eukprot:37354-Karenia_brevis.AAC.1
MAFARKKDWVAHKSGVACKPTALRPLNMKNTDVKAISGAALVQLNPVTMKSAHHMQRGFIPSRNFIYNVVELDAWARKVGYDTGQ